MNVLLIMSCVLTKSAEITNDCYLSECDSAVTVQELEVFFEPNVARLDAALACRSSVLLPYATPRYRWLNNQVPIPGDSEEIVLSSSIFSQGDQITCTIEWIDGTTLYSTGTASISIE